MHSTYQPITDQHFNLFITLQANEEVHNWHILFFTGTTRIVAYQKISAIVIVLVFIICNCKRQLYAYIWRQLFIFGTRIFR